MSTTNQIIRGMFGKKRYRVGWEAFAYFLDERNEGAGVEVAPQDLIRLRRTIEQNELDGEWLLVFAERESVRRAAGEFASKIRTAGRRC